MLGIWLIVAIKISKTDLCYRHNNISIYGLKEMCFCIKIDIFFIRTKFPDNDCIVHLFFGFIHFKRKLSALSLLNQI
jgi:hypothetical protein